MYHIIVWIHEKSTPSRPWPRSWHCVFARRRANEWAIMHLIIAIVSAIGDEIGMAWTHCNRHRMGSNWRARMSCGEPILIESYWERLDRIPVHRYIGHLSITQHNLISQPALWVKDSHEQPCKHHPHFVFTISITQHNIVNCVQIYWKIQHKITRRSPIRSDQPFSDLDALKLNSTRLAANDSLNYGCGSTCELHMSSSAHGAIIINNIICRSIAAHTLPLPFYINMSDLAGAQRIRDV